MERRVVGYYFRRFLFYLLLLSFCAGIDKFPFLADNLTFWYLALHAVYFELDLENVRSRPLVLLLHSASFGGSFSVCVLAILLVSYYNDHFVSQRAAREHHSLADEWMLIIYLHWLMPLWLSLDLYLNLETLRKIYNFPAFKKRKIAFLGSVFAMFVMPGVLAIIWLAVGYDPVMVYKTKHNYIGLSATCMMSMNFVMTLLLVWILNGKPIKPKLVEKKKGELEEGLRLLNSSTENRPTYNNVMDEEKNLVFS